jgi:dTDP-4-dehydrorhamnose 3,5-epimerase
MLPFPATEIQLLSDAIRDRSTVTPSGESLEPVPAGVVFYDLRTQVDDRGMLCEMFDNRWEVPGGPLVYAYVTTIRPGYAKGWGLHHHHDDRYFILFGHMETVLYDERPGAPTHGMVSTIVLSEARRRLMIIPAGVWHASRNLSDREAVFINFPTAPYDHENPDKHRLPLVNGRIPHRFPDTRGG